MLKYYLFVRPSLRNKGDEAILKAQFRYYVGRPLDLENPKTLNEKMQWLKLHDRNPEHTVLVDKVEAKGRVREILGDRYVIPTLAVYDSADGIDFDALPERFVLKCNHDSHSVVVCRDKRSLDRKKVKRDFAKALKHNYYYDYREWPYKDVRPRILAEEYVTDGDGSDVLTDYKFYCFNGRADCVMICTGRATGNLRYYFFDRDWNFKPYTNDDTDLPADFTLPKPSGMDEMFDIAEKLSKGMKFVRIDLYQSNGQILFGEYTFFTDSGYDTDLTPEADRYFGDLLDLGI